LHGFHFIDGPSGPDSVQVFVLPRHQPPKSAQLFAPTMRLPAPQRPAMRHAEQPEPPFVEFANHRFPISGFQVSAFVSGPSGSDFERRKQQVQRASCDGVARNTFSLSSGG